MPHRKEAVAFVERYQATELERVHFLFADKTGQSVIIGAYEGKITYTWKTQAHQVLTNFNIVDPEYGGEQPCPRFATAQDLLSQNADPMEVLRQTTQGDLTVYTTLFDLTAGVVQVSYRANFTKIASFSLSQEWSKGAHNVLLSDIFR